MKMIQKTTSRTRSPLAIWSRRARCWTPARFSTKLLCIWN